MASQRAEMRQLQNNIEEAETVGLRQCCMLKVPSWLQQLQQVAVPLRRCPARCPAPCFEAAALSLPPSPPHHAHGVSYAHLQTRLRLKKEQDLVVGERDVLGTQVGDRPDAAAVHDAALPLFAAVQAGSPAGTRCCCIAARLPYLPWPLIPVGGMLRGAPWAPAATHRSWCAAMRSCASCMRRSRCRAARCGAGRQRTAIASTRSGC